MEVETMFDVLKSMAKTRAMLKRIQRQALTADNLPIHIAQRIQNLHDARQSLIELSRKWSEGASGIVDAAFDGLKPQEDDSNNPE